MTTTSSPSSPPLLDHIVILVSQSTLVELPFKLKDHFVVAPGGSHANGVTVNKLILFQDGVYIELIAFVDGVDPAEREKHRWGRLKEGRIVDWAYTLPKKSDFASVQTRVRDTDSGILYDDPVAGGRTRPDGTVLKWATASGRYEHGNPTWPGRLPFWCLDETPRHFRVPYDGKTDAHHPSGARGVSSVSVPVPAKELDSFERIYDAIHAANGHQWRFGVPSGLVSGKQSIELFGTEHLPHIELTLLASEKSPSSIELVPGVVVKFERGGDQER